MANSAALSTHRPLKTRLRPPPFTKPPPDRHIHKQISQYQNRLIRGTRRYEIENTPIGKTSQKQAGFRGNRQAAGAGSDSLEEDALRWVGGGIPMRRPADRRSQLVRHLLTGR